MYTHNDSWGVPIPMFQNEIHSSQNDNPQVVNNLSGGLCHPSRRARTSDAFPELLSYPLLIAWYNARLLIPDVSVRTFFLCVLEWDFRAGIQYLAF